MLTFFFFRNNLKNPKRGKIYFLSCFENFCKFYISIGIFINFSLILGYISSLHWEFWAFSLQSFILFVNIIYTHH